MFIGRVLYLFGYVIDGFVDMYAFHFPGFAVGIMVNLFLLCFNFKFYILDNFS